MKTRNVIVLMSLVASCVGFCLGYYCPKQSEVVVLNPDAQKDGIIQAYEVYYMDVENLLDTISARDESFLDTTGETDTYFDYCQSRKRVNDSYIVK